MSKLLARLKAALRIVGGLAAGVVGSGAVAEWLFALFEALNVEMDPAKGSVGPVAWGAMLATWAASGFAGQFVAANIGQVAVLIWFVAAVDAAILLFAYSLLPHPVFLAGAVVGFLVAFRLKDSDLLFIGKVVRVSR